MCVTPTAHWLEYVDWANPILKAPLEIVAGQAVLRNEPGSGIEWDEAQVKKYAYESSQSPLLRQALITAPSRFRSR